MKKTNQSKINQNSARRKMKDNFIGFGIVGLIISGLMFSGDGAKGAAFLFGLGGVSLIWIGFKIPLYSKVADVYERKGHIERGKSGW